MIKYFFTGVRCLLLILLYFTCLPTLACKLAQAPELYTLENLNSNDQLVVLFIEEANQAGELLTERISATVLKVYRGKLKVGEKIVASHQIEEARAICGVHFETGSAYLVALRPFYNRWKYSRFDLSVGVFSPAYERYSKQLARE
jgi:hypothetical protein